MKQISKFIEIEQDSNKLYQVYIFNIEKDIHMVHQTKEQVENLIKDIPETSYEIWEE